MPRTTGGAMDPNRSGNDVDGNTIRLSDGFVLADARFAQAGPDLLVSGADGRDTVLRGYFDADVPPDLVSTAGVQVAGRMVATVARGEAAVPLAEALFGAGAGPVGTVATVSGTLSVIRADGTEDTLQPGDPVYPRDILETGPDSTASIAIGENTAFSLGTGARIILAPGAPDDTATADPFALAAGPGEYAFACGAAPDSMIIDTPAGRIHADGAELVLTYLADGGLRLVLIPGADGSVGGIWVENEAGSLHMTLPYQLILVEGASMAPDAADMLNSEAIVAGYGRVLSSLPDTCASNPLVAAARAADVDTADLPEDLALDSGDLSEEGLRALAEFETDAGNEAAGDTPGDATFTDAKVVVTQQDPLSGDSGYGTAPTAVAIDTWAQPPSGTTSDGAGTGNSNEAVINSLIEVAGQDTQRITFPEPPGVRPPKEENLRINDWDPAVQRWKVLVSQEPSEYAQDAFYFQSTHYYEPKPFAFFRLNAEREPDDSEKVARTYSAVPSDDGGAGDKTMLILSPGPGTGFKETGRGAEIEDIASNRFGFFDVPLNQLPGDTDGSKPVDGAAIKTASALRINAGETKTISFDWAFDARDEVAFNDYAIFIVNGEWFKLSDTRTTGKFEFSGWRRSEFEYTASTRENLTIGFAVINDADDANEPRLLIDNVRVDNPISDAYQEIDEPVERGGAALPGEAAFRTFSPPPTAVPDAISTTEDASVTIGAADLLANDVDPNATRGLSLAGPSNDSNPLGTVTFSDANTVKYDPNGMFESLADGEKATDSFEYEITNLSGGRDTATVTVTITGVNDAPVAQNDNVNATEDTAATGNVLANNSEGVGEDIDVDGDSLTVTAVNDAEANVGAEITLASGALLTVNSDGTFIYDPNARFESLAAGESDRKSFTYTVADGHGGTDTATVEITVDGENDAPTANNDIIRMDEDTVRVGPVLLLSNDSDPDSSDTLAVTSVNGNPAGVGTAIALASGALLTLEADGSYSLDPNGRFDGLSLGQADTDGFTYTVDDGNGGTDTASVVVQIAGVNDAPIANPVTRTTNEDAGTFSINLLDSAVTSDVDLGDSLVITNVTQDTGASDSDLADAFDLIDGVLSFDITNFDTLAVGQSATLVFDYTVDDQRGQSNSTAANTVTVTIEGRNDAPTAIDDRQPVSEDAILTVVADPASPIDPGLLANDTDPDTDSELRISAVNGIADAVDSPLQLASGAFITVKADGSFTYDQNGQFDYLKDDESETDRFEYTVSDQYGGTDTGTVTLEIVGQNDAPIANNDTLTISEDEVSPPAVSRSVLANDSDPEGEPLTVTAFELTTGLGARVVMAANGTYTYDPTVSAVIQALGDGNELDDTFTYDVTDGSGGTATGTVTVTVQGTNDAPDASDVSYRTLKASTLEIDAARGVLLNDTDVDEGDVLSLTAVNGEAADVGSQVQLSSGALLTVNADGTFSYDPNSRFDGLGDTEKATDSFSYTVSDGAGLTDTATVSLTITGFNEQLVGSFDKDLTGWDSAGSVERIVSHRDPEDDASRYDPTDGPGMAIIEADGASTSEIETDLKLASGALPNDEDLTRPVSGAATWTEVSVRTGDEISFDWNFDTGETAATPGANDYAVFTVSDGTTSKVFKLSDVRDIGDAGASGWQTFSYDPTQDFNIGTGDQKLTFGFAAVNDQNDENPSRLLVDNVRIAWELPAPVNDVFIVSADVPLAADPARSLLANDRDASETGTLFVFAVNPTDLDDGKTNIGTPITLASEAVLTVNVDGTFSLDPSSSEQLRELADGEVFIDGFTYAIAHGNDRESLGTASVEIQFTGVNDPPIAGDDGAFTDEHSVVQISVERLLANDTDPDGSDTLTITAVDGSGATGTVTLGDDGVILYDPGGPFSDLAPGEQAVDTFRYTVEDGNGGTSTGTVNARVVGQADPPAPLGQIITSFEDAPVGEWDLQWDRIKSFGSEPVSLVTDYTETDGAEGTFRPTSGDQMVVLEAFGSFEDPVTNVADFLQVSARLTDSDGSSAADGSAMKTTVKVEAGDEISFDWMFDARDQSAGGNEVFNDYAVLTVSGPDGEAVFKLADVRQTGDFGASGWRTSKYVAASDGELSLGFAVMNDAVPHGVGDPRNSRLVVDNVRLDRDFGEGYQQLDGGPTDTFQTWVQPPSAAEDAYVASEDVPLVIPAGGLLANDTPATVGGPIDITEVDASGTLGTVTRGPDGAIGYDPGGAFESLSDGETVTDVFFYTVTGENGGTAEAAISITVQGANDAPVARADIINTDEDTAVTGNVLSDNGAGRDTDVEGDSLTVTRVNGVATNVGSQIMLASGALLLVNADGTFSYDADGRFEFLGAGEEATDSFTYTVDDGQGGTATASVSVLVTGVNDPPVANDDASSTNEDTAVTIDLLANDTDAETPAPVLTGLSDSATVGSLTPNADGTVTYDPSGRFDSLAEGETATDTFGYTIEDGAGGVGVATVTVEVVGINDAPVAENDAASTDEDTPLTIAVLDNDIDAEDDPRTITELDDNATLGRVTLNGDGTVSYDPDGQFEGLDDGETATDTFRYTVSDGNGGTDVATVTVTVNGVDEGGGVGELVESFEGTIDPALSRGAVSTAFDYNEPDGAKDTFSPTDGNTMAVMRASGASSLSIDSFLDLSVPLPKDFGDSTDPRDGSALKLTVDVEEGDQISFDWMFDANDVVQPPLGDFARPGFNDFAVFSADGEWFNLSDVRQVYDESGAYGASGWRASIYTAQSDGPLTIGFAVVNDDTTTADSHLLVDNIRINKDFDPDSYTVVRSDPSGLLNTVVQNPDV